MPTVEDETQTADRFDYKTPKLHRKCSLQFVQSNQDKTSVYRRTHINLFKDAFFGLSHVEMDDFEQEGIDEELIEFAIRESIQDANKPSRSLQRNW